MAATRASTATERAPTSATAESARRVLALILAELPRSRLASSLSRWPEGPPDERVTAGTAALAAGDGTSADHSTAPVATLLSSMVPRHARRPSVIASATMLSAISVPRHPSAGWPTGLPGTRAAIYAQSESCVHSQALHRIPAACHCAWRCRPTARPSWSRLPGRSGDAAGRVMSRDQCSDRVLSDVRAPEGTPACSTSRCYSSLAGPRSRSTRTQSFHWPSSCPWRRCTPTSSKPAARWAARLGWLSENTRLVSL